MVDLMSQMQKVLHERPQGALLINTKPNLREQVNLITTRSGLTIAEPSIPPYVPPNPRVPEKLNDPGKFLIPCVLQDHEVCNSLADSGASINLMPLSIYEKLGIRSLKPTRMTLELANRSITFSMGIAKDVIVKVEKFYFLVDFVIVDFEADPRVPIILGRPFLRTARALVDLYEEKLTLRVENEEVVFYTEKSSRNNLRDIHCVHCINIIGFLKDKQSHGSTTSHFDDFLPAYEAFCFDIEEKSSEKSSGSTTSHSDLSPPEYESFHFDLSIDPLPPADRSDSQHEEFANKLAFIISPPEYDHFYFDLELNDIPLFLSDCDSVFSEKFSKIDLLVLFPPENKDKVFDPRIFTINGVHSKRFSILFLDDFSSILFLRDFLSTTDPSEIDTFLSFSSGNEDKVFDLGILLNNGIFSSTRKSPHLLIDNFMIDNCHILSEISLKIVSSICFHPKDKEIQGESR
uniref:Reverse transcriptase domain-containing protein n=1 Tax=Tanacetum cinerariifolium TaxID=118510 RepID=A0A699IU08_TANCI|nr:reverse transcriptase domain-containing protein [Tanacetum cinerariifolium]